MVSPVRKLNQLLRLAAISGVETAIKLHIRRGDDLDARDSSGATPLILAAGRRRKGVVRLLLDAEANPMLVDQSGMNALDHAVKGGCSETIAILTEAVALFTAAEPVAEPIVSKFENELKVELEALPPMVETLDAEASPIVKEPLEVVTSVNHLRATEIHGGTFFPDKSSSSTSVITPEVKPSLLVLDDGPLENFCTDDWEAEEEVSAPSGDDTVAEVARKVHEAIGRHKVVDSDENWADVDLYLPVRAAPLVRNEEGAEVRKLLLAALREGMISEARLIDVCSNADGSRNEEAERLLAFVAQELGATVVEWTGLDEPPFLSDASMQEERLLTEAVEFAEDLASGRNDPFRFFSKGISGDLLDAEEEIALGREMEEAGREALYALASWPKGLLAVFDAADRVASGEADAESFTAGPETSSDKEPDPGLVGTAEEEDGQSELDQEAAFFVNAVAVVKACGGDARRAADALEAARLTRGFLMKLADEASADQAARDFVESLTRQAKARERMILSNLRLALSIAKKFLWSGIPFDDLVQEANIGLMKAVERYDWRRGFRFSTYATWWIRQQVSRSIADVCRVVRAPVHIQDTARKVLRERELAEARHGRPETESETARRIGMTIGKTRMLLAMFEDAVSLDEIDPESGLSRVESLIDERSLDPESSAERASLRRTLLGMLENFDKRERNLILMRFGLMGGEPMTFEEVGRYFGVTRERIRQIESKLMRRLSHRNKREILWPFMGDRYAPDCTSSSNPSKAETSVGADDKLLQIDEPSETLESVIEKVSPSFPPIRPEQEAQRVDLPIRDAKLSFSYEYGSSTQASALTDDRASRIADQARMLGLSVEDRRAEGGVLRIVVPFASSPTIEMFGRKLLAYGFHKIQRDVFVK